MKNMIKTHFYFTNDWNDFTVWRRWWKLKINSTQSVKHAETTVKLNSKELNLYLKLTKCIKNKSVKTIWFPLNRLGKLVISLQFSLSALTCEEQPGLWACGLRDCNRAGGLIKRVANPPCRGCRGVGMSSFSNTEEKTSLSTWNKKKQRPAINALIRAETNLMRQTLLLGTITLIFCLWRNLQTLHWCSQPATKKKVSPTFWASSFTLVQSGLSAKHRKYSCKASSFRSALLSAVAFRQWAWNTREKEKINWCWAPTTLSKHLSGSKLERRWFDSWRKLTTFLGMLLCFCWWHL